VLKKETLKLKVKFQIISIWYSHVVIATQSDTSWCLARWRRSWTSLTAEDVFVSATVIRDFHLRKGFVYFEMNASLFSRVGRFVEGPEIGFAVKSLVREAPLINFRRHLFGTRPVV